jgi:hypothetical protein
MLPQWKGGGNVMVEVKSIAITGSSRIIGKVRRD